MPTPDLNDNRFDGEAGLTLDPAPAAGTAAETKTEKIDIISAADADDDSDIEPTFIIDENLTAGPDTENINIAVRRESARSKIAYLYVSSFLAIIGIVFLYSVIRNLANNDLKDLLISVSGILSGPLGFIIGYYFKVEDENKGA